MVGFAQSPNDGVHDHLLYEWGRLGPGQLGPSVFMSVSVGNPAVDPPIASAIFTIGPDGSPTITAALTGNGTPALERQDVGVGQVPAPATLVLLAAAALMPVIKIGWGRRRSRRSSATVFSSPGIR